MIKIKRVHYSKHERLIDAYEALDKLGIDYTVHNQGYHAIINSNGKEYQYWPSTGKWIGYMTKWTDKTRFLPGLLDELGYEYELLEEDKK